MEIPGNADQTISLILDCVMEDIGVTKAMINRRRMTYLGTEVTLSLAEMILGLKTICFHFGSQVEAATTLGMNSDIDSLRYMNDWPVILRVDDWKAGKNNLLLLRNQHIPPQHCYLQRLSNESPEPLTNLPLFNHEKDDKGRVLIKNTYFSSSAERISRRVGKKFIEHGPSLSHSDMVDYVFCFHCKEVPDVCNFWIKRHRPGRWPPENVQMMAMNAGIFLLPLGHPESDRAPVEWRFSTSSAERLLMFELSTCQLKVYVLLKMIRSTYIKKAVGDRLSSYHLKTALLYTIENSPPWVWREDNLLQCVLYCLITVARWLRQNYAPHYIVEGVNLFTGKLKIHELHSLENLIWNMINTKLQCILGIKMDSVGTRLWTSLHKRHLGNSSIGQFASRDKIECDIAAELAEQYFGFLNHSLNEVLVKANKASFSQAYNTFKTNLALFEMGLLHPDPFKRDGMKLFIKYMSSVLATMQVSQCIRTNSQILLPNHFKMSLDFDLASCKLKLASVYYCIREYTKAAEILSTVVHSFQPFVLSACECRKRTMKKPTNAFARRALAGTNQDTLKGSVVFCVKFLRHEEECVPKHLIFEMYRAIGGEDMQIRDPWHDSWMDMAVVDAIPFAYYLQYLTYRELGLSTSDRDTGKALEDARVEAVENIADYVDKNNGYGHIETVCNLVGHCFELEGLFDQALEWYLESLLAMPRNNAALWHITLLLHTLFQRENIH